MGEKMGVMLTATGMKTHQFTYIHNSIFANEVLEIAKGREQQENGISILIKHNDAYGYLEAGECEQIFEAIKDMHIPKENDTEDGGFEYMLDCWRYMTKYCSENKQRLEYR